MPTFTAPPEDSSDSYIAVLSLFIHQLGAFAAAPYFESDLVIAADDVRLTACDESMTANSIAIRMPPGTTATIVLEAMMMGEAAMAVAALVHVLRHVRENGLTVEARTESRKQMSFICDAISARLTANGL